VTKSREPLVVLQRLGIVHFHKHRITIMNSRQFYRRPEPRVAAHPQLALRPREAAAAIGVSPSTLERLTKAGEIAYVPAGRCRLFLVADLETYLTTRRVVAEKGGDR
jgi:excisionase family DNA binding protein